MPQRLSDIPLADLIPETRAWNNGDGISIGSWLGCIGSFEHAIAYGELFWPDFAEHDGCILFAGFREEIYREFMEQTNGNRKAVEAVMNHRHIVDLFGNTELKPTRAQVVYLGRLLKEMLAAKLRSDFPDKELVVSFAEEPCEDPVDYQLTFFQERG